MKKSVFKISKMDCPSEESLIRMKLDGIESVRKLDFDIPNRALAVYHSAEIAVVDRALNDLDLGSVLVSTEESETDLNFDNIPEEKRLLWLVLLINFCFFIIEVISGYFSNSLGLVADSLDMLADAIIYGLSLFAAGQIATKKKRVAAVSGYFQVTLAFIGLIEVIRRFAGSGGIPSFQTMIVVSLFALIGNAASLYLLQRSKNREAHMQASLIFTSNDVVANLGVIVAGISVYFTNSRIPDLIIGLMVFLLVAKGALRILKLSRS